MPKRKFSSTEGVVKEEPKRRLVKLLVKRAPAKVETKKSENVAGRNKSSGNKKKVETKGDSGPKGKQAEVANQEMKEDLLAGNGETKEEESTASNEAGEKEAKSDEYHILCLISENSGILDMGGFDFLECQLNIP
ncbi:non-histone chromosomal protein HMG-14-like [Meles meles]|uniref:non-histone chromosomal protein HMG-14-like n=1 Tax=Meles meles TaxID=9662 RepID=UPI001E699491|nr:non-histone chromosomal protein HMG-14-like [Meles meles]